MKGDKCGDCKKKEDNPPGKPHPEVHFDNSYGHPGYDRKSLNVDVADVKIHTIKAGSSTTKCALNDWTTVQYKVFQDERMVEDSRAQPGKLNGTRPKLFRLGHYEVSKCWDIAL
jgi:hypothetical protein